MLSRGEFEYFAYMIRVKQIFIAIVFVLFTFCALFFLNITSDIPLEDLKTEFKKKNSRFLEVDGTLVHYVDEGEGIPIILLHGTGSSLHTWDLWAERLKDKYRVLRITLPGFGLSGPRSDKKYKIKDYVNLLESFVEKIGVKKFIGIALGFIGALVLVLQGTENSLRAPNVSLGNFLFLLNSIFFSSFIIMVKPLTQKYNTISILKWLFFMGFFMTLPVTTDEFDEIDWINLPFDAIWRITFVVLGTTFLTYLLNLFALKKLQASTVGAFAYAQPIIAISFAIINGNDYLSLERGLACSVIILGVFLVSQKSN